MSKKYIYMKEKKMKFLDKIYSPQLNRIHSGKVRESFKIDDKTRMIVVSDRVSSFDSVLNNLIPEKGAVLNGITNFWFEKTKDIIGNHLIKAIDPNISLVKEAVPIRIEMIVRNYLTGSMWRGYQKGKREFSGVKVPDDLSQNDKFPEPLITPTTKEEHDREITPEEIVEAGWTTHEIYQKMEKVALHLFQKGTEELAEKGIILVDTKYEFGLWNGKLILIDELHTPDSSRFWDKKIYEKDQQNVDSMDKEFIRQWLLKNKKDGKLPNLLPQNVIMEASKRYKDIFEKITGMKFVSCQLEIKQRIHHHLVQANLIKDGYVALVMGSPKDNEHAEKLKNILKKYEVFVEKRVISAHKNGERIPELAKIYNNSIEPGCVLAIAGRSNGLGGALAANLAIPVINCPPFKDKIDMMVNINSSLMMPSKTPAMTVIDVNSAALAALRSLNLQRLKNKFQEEIVDMKEDLKKADEEFTTENT